MAGAGRLFVTRLTPREREALRLIEERPGISTTELAQALGVTRGRVWQIVHRLSGRARVRVERP